MYKSEQINTTIAYTCEAYKHKLHKHVKNKILRVDLRRSSTADIEAII